MESITQNIKDKYNKFKDALLLKKTCSKLDIINEKYKQLEHSMKSKPYSHKFLSIIESNTYSSSVSRCIVFCQIKFKNKDVTQVIKDLAKENNVELTEEEIIDIAAIIFEFLYCLHDLGMF